jgi:alpha-ketoglutarate-dependent taurine dioxygenase
MGHRRGKTSLALNKERTISKATFENMKPMIGATVHVARKHILDEDVILACRGALEDQPPPKATLLSTRKISQRGGQTEFANLTAAYPQLSDEEKSDYSGLRVQHTLSAAVRPVVEYVAKDTVALLDVTADSGRTMHRTSIEGLTKVA